VFLASNYLFFIKVKEFSKIEEIMILLFFQNRSIRPFFLLFFFQTNLSLRALFHREKTVFSLGLGLFFFFSFSHKLIFVALVHWKKNRFQLRITISFFFFFFLFSIKPVFGGLILFGGLRRLPNLPSE
jgi:hypothetical protein